VENKAKMASRAYCEKVKYSILANVDIQQKGQNYQNKNLGLLVFCIDPSLWAAINPSKILDKGGEIPDLSPSLDKDPTEFNYTVEMINPFSILDETHDPELHDKQQKNLKSGSITIENQANKAGRTRHKILSIPKDNFSSRTDQHPYQVSSHLCSQVQNKISNTLVKPHMVDSDFPNFQGPHSSRPVILSTLSLDKQIHF
jgi:hypothetical protein